ncbi:ABC transporter ATP-binding protein [Eubacterium sp. 1001713B170207_170306_E7]|uniref:ABC transporter ATP-binding protein n=1 Tax=Eubacterium sp. 1001713B170207_170306_E7 TaxID=2787097 RepID=UPI0018980B80|nr:ABC transporter ATP-binding protein [Eubacterium sp. 1001713B170207_170306_E7]
MDEIVLKATDLCKSYGSFKALDHLSLTIEKGKTYGLIGQNGAGKTTFIRQVCGLSYPSAGELSLFGKREEKGLREGRKRMGCLVETPALYQGMTARQNMEAQRILRGIPDKRVVEKTLELVGLTDTGRKTVRHFSLGMKQRLGIAMALISDPEFLILDEPINGLDPVGIVEIRELLKRLNTERGTTLLISSHILSELYQTVDHFIIIDQGHIVEALTQEELDERCRRHIAIEVDDTARAAAVIEQSLHTDNYKVMPDGTIKLYDHLEEVRAVSAALSQGGLLLTGISVRGDSLEDYFLQSIGGRKNG